MYMYYVLFSSVLYLKHSGGIIKINQVIDSGYKFSWISKFRKIRSGDIWNGGFKVYVTILHKPFYW